MEDQAGLVETAGVTMPPRPRPRSSDSWVVSEAALDFGKHMAKDHADLLDGATAEDFQGDLIDVLPIHDTDGVELANAMGRRHGYEVDLGFIEIMGLWDGYLRTAHDRAVAAWVRETAPARPFEDVARVEFEGIKGRAPGVAYMSPAYEGAARCLVVPDADRDRFTRDGAFSGGIVVDWENLHVVGPATEGDLAMHRATGDAETRRLRDREYGTFAHARDKAYDAAVTRFMTATRAMPTEAMVARLAVVMADVAGSAEGTGFDAASDAAAEIQALLQRLRSHGNREAFLRRERDPAAGTH
jgi:hypothetical protein